MLVQIAGRMLPPSRRSGGVLWRLMNWLFGFDLGWGTDDFKVTWLMIYSAGGITEHPDDDGLCIISAGGALYECMGTVAELVAAIGDEDDIGETPKGYVM